jgi:SNF2 family DNA or RNA helicase
MPELINNYIDIKLQDEEIDKYNEMASKAYTYVKGKEISVKDQIALSNKLMQLANGRCYDREKNTVFVHNAKLDKLKEIVETSFGKSILVLSNFICDTEAILKSIPGTYQLKSDTEINLWNQGKIPVMVANPKSCGHGLNLQDGGNIIIWYSMTWSLELYMQANARLYRQGQKNTVVINHLVAADTIDNIAIQVLSRKFDTQEALLNALKEKKFLLKKD